MYLVINKCVTAVKVSNFSGHYLRNRSTLDIGVLGYIGIVQHKEHSPEILSIPPGTPCICEVEPVAENMEVDFLSSQYCEMCITRPDTWPPDSQHMFGYPRYTVICCLARHTRSMKHCLMTLFST